MKLIVARGSKPKNLSFPFRKGKLEMSLCEFKVTANVVVGHPEGFTRGLGEHFCSGGTCTELVVSDEEK